MPVYTRVGELPNKRHVQFRSPGGKLYQEEVYGSRGFDGRYSILYHLYPPTEIQGVELISYDIEPKSVSASEGLKHRHLRLGDATVYGDAVSGRKVILFNSDISIGVCAPKVEMDYFFSNGNCDDIIFVQEGSGTLFSQFGSLPYREGDYIVIPKGTIYQIKTNSPEAELFLVIETPGNIELPHRFMNEYGQLLEHSPFYTRDLVFPEATPPRDERGDFEVRVKTRSHLMAYHWVKWCH